MNDFNLDDYSVTVLNDIDTLGYKGLELLREHDYFRSPRVGRTLNVTELYISCKLNRTECDYLIRQLSYQGVDTSIAQTAAPDIRYIPKVFKDLEADDLEHYQVKNFMEFWLPLILNTCRSQIKPSIKLPKCYVNNGVVQVNSNAEEHIFNPYNGNLADCVEVYPHNLTLDVINFDRYIFPSERNLDFAAAWEDVLDTLTPYEQELLYSYYKYGYSLGEILGIENIPEYDTLTWEYNRALKKAIRKLRHPSRFKKIRPYINEEFCRKEVDYSLAEMDLYWGFTSEVTNVVKRLWREKRNLEDALSWHYSDSVISIIKKNISRWCVIPDIPVSNMNLTRRISYSLKHAGIKNLKDIWQFHGRDVDLYDFQNTGLITMYGIREEDAKEIFDIMRCYVSDALDENRIADMVGYLETIIRDENLEAPDLICLPMPNAVLSCLFTLGHRNLREVKTDYVSGQLKEKFDNLDTEPFECWGNYYGPSWEYVDKIVKQFVENQFPAKEYISTRGWDIDLIQKDPESFYRIRDKYLRDEIRGDYDLIEEVIPAYFPDRPCYFELLNGTRTQRWNWIPFPTSLASAILKCVDIEGRIKESYYGITIDEEIYSEYMSGGDLVLPEDFFYMKYDSNGNAIYSFEKIIAVVECEERTLCSIIDIERVDYCPLTSFAGLKVSLMDESADLELLLSEIEFNAELYSDPKFKGRKEMANNECYGELQHSLCRYCIEKFCLDTETANLFRELQDDTAKYEDLVAKWIRTPKTKEIVYMEIEDMDLSVRSFNCLKRAGINTLEDLLARTEEDMMKVRNLGRKSLEEVKGKVESLGYDWI